LNGVIALIELYLIKFDRLGGLLRYVVENRRKRFGAEYPVPVIHCVSKKTSPPVLAITRESIDGFL